jgi:dUTP pyrophosphatase
MDDNDRQRPATQRGDSKGDPQCALGIDPCGAWVCEVCYPDGPWHCDRCFQAEECCACEDRDSSSLRPAPTLKVRRTTAPEIPAYATAGASGLDLHSPVSVRLAPSTITIVPLGIEVEIPDGYEGQVRGRSSLARGGVLAILGTIDSDYRGEVAVMLHNANPTAWVELEKGERIAQLVIVPVARVRVEEVEALSETDRGAGGFGSTGR